MHKVRTKIAKAKIFQTLTALLGIASLALLGLSPAAANTDVPNHDDEYLTEEATLDAQPDDVDLGDMTPEEAANYLESAGYVNQGTSAENPDMDTYAAELAEGVGIAVDVPKSSTEEGMVQPMDIAIGWDPLPYLYGTGEQWAQFAQTALTGSAGIACGVVNAAFGGGCAAVANMVLNNIGRPGDIPNADQCYVMKNINLAPEEAPASECS